MLKKTLLGKGFFFPSWVVCPVQPFSSIKTWHWVNSEEAIDKTDSLAQWLQLTSICTFITDLCGYVKRLLRVEKNIFNLKPVAQKIGTPEEETSEITKSWKNEDDQLKALLQPWDKEAGGQLEDLDKLRKGLENLKEEG